MMRLFALVLTLISFNTFAAGGSGHVSDLAFPAINFVILLSILIWKIKTPTREFFNQQAKDIAYLYESAEQKDKEAQVKLEALQSKMSNLSSEKEKVEVQAKEEVEKFRAKASKETEDYLTRIARDVDQKVAHEKEVMLKNLQEELVDEVISKTKNSIQSDSAKANKVTENLVARI